MEKIPTNLIKSTHENITECFAAHLYKSKGLTIKHALELDMCEIKDTANQLKITEEIKANVLEGNDVLLYLNTDLEYARLGNVITNKGNGQNYIPFICIGWSDYDYVITLDDNNKKIRNRGFYIVCPIDKLPVSENLYYIPYKLAKTADRGIIEEMWTFNNIKSSVIPFRQKIEMRIGRDMFTDSGKNYETDAIAHYYNGNPMIPLRTLAERLGYTVRWDRRNKTAILTNYDLKEIKVKEGYNYCKVNEEDIPLTIAPYINKYSNRMFITIGFVKHVFNLDAKFDTKRETIIIYRK